MKLSVKILILILAVFFITSTLFVFSELGGYRKYRYYIEKICEQKGVEVELALAVARTESSFDESAVSKKGAVGLMQIMPSTAEYIAKKVKFDKELDLYNPQTNLYLGICYLEYLFNRYGDERVVLACYNAGEGTVSKWTEEDIKNPPYRETKKYIEKVKRRKFIYSIFI